MFGNVNYKAEYDFVNSIPDYRDVYIELTGLPFGALRVGNFYEQFCLEELTSDNYITLMERSAVDLFAPGRNPGIMARNTFAESRGTWAFGVFRQDTSPGISQENGAYAETGRITFLPVDENEGKRLVHVGVAVSHRRPPEKTRSYSLRPSAHLASNLVRTGSFAAERAILVGGEAAWVEGPLSLQGEVGLVTHAAPDTGDGDAVDMDPGFLALYLEASYFVTGEHRPYKKADGAFDRVEPNSNYGDGSGALQLAARVSHADLEDPDNGIAGGTLTDVTLGANWYLNSHTRVMVNYVMGLPKRSEEMEGETVDLDGTVNVLQTRFAIDF
jgi:phosphate-selective porin OprO and OprP